MTRVQKRLQELASLQPGWDSYDAKVPTKAALDTAEKLAKLDRYVWSIFPQLDGGVTLEAGEYEIFVSEDGTVEDVLA